MSQVHVFDVSAPSSPYTFYWTHGSGNRKAIKGCHACTVPPAIPRKYCTGYGILYGPAFLCCPAPAFVPIPRHGNFCVPSRNHRSPDSRPFRPTLLRLIPVPLCYAGTPNRPKFYWPLFSAIHKRSSSPVFCDCSGFILLYDPRLPKHILNR